MKLTWLLIIFLSLASCRDFDELQSVPVMISRTELESSIKLEASREIRQPGATAIFGATLYVVEKYQGIHIVDNSNRASPKRVGFLRIPGVWQSAIINGRLITDNSRDILSFELSNPFAPSLQSRARDLLLEPPAKFMIANPGSRPIDSLVIDYRDTIVHRSEPWVS